MQFAPVVISLAVGVGLGVVVRWSLLSTRAAGVWRRVLHRSPVSGFRAVRMDEIEWRRNQQHEAETTFFMRPLARAEELGSALMLVRYPAGEINPEHVHSQGHGLYVLEGELVTHRGTFGPHTFVWFPAHEAMWHGAGPREDVTILFSAGPDMKTRYLKPLRSS